MGECSEFITTHRDARSVIQIDVSGRLGPGSEMEATGMSGKRCRKQRKLRKVLVESALPEEVRREMPSGLKSILVEYLRLLLQTPVETFGQLDNELRARFVKQVAKGIVGQAPMWLSDSTVLFLVNLGKPDEDAKTEIEEDFIVGLFTLLFVSESYLSKLGNEALESFSLDESMAESFRVLAGEFGGTFEELIETARRL
jgi:hypothetical protein